MSREFGAVRGARQIALAAVGQSVTIGEQTMVIPRECRRAKGSPSFSITFRHISACRSLSFRGLLW